MAAGHMTGGAAAGDLTRVHDSIAGLPKAARISHLKTLMCCAFYQLCGAHADDVIYMSLPLYHKSGALLGVGGCIGIGEWSHDVMTTTPRGQRRVLHSGLFLPIRGLLSPQGAILRLSVLERLPQTQRDGLPVHRGAVPLPDQPAAGTAAPTPAHRSGIFSRHVTHPSAYPCPRHVTLSF